MSDEGAPATGEGEASQGAGNNASQDDEALRSEGVKALNEWKNRAKQAETSAKAFEKRIAELEEATKSERDKAIDEVRNQTREETLSSVTPKLVAATIKVEAIGKVHDDFIDLVASSLQGRWSEFLDAQGNPDEAAINKAIADLVTKKPALGRPQGSGDGGPRGSGLPATADMNKLIRQKAGYA